MMNYVALIFILYLADIRANLIFKAKFMGNWRVTGDSIVLHALSVSHCLAMCNKNATCDAITFQDKLNKCQLFKRCMPLRMVHKSTHHWFYAKRPPISVTGYHYEALSDSCLAVKNKKISYEEVDNFCAEDRAYAAVLSTPNLLNLADHILQQSGQNDAWINPPCRIFEKFAHNREMQKKPKIILTEEYGVPVRECWILRNGAAVKVCPCLETTEKFTICQLPTY